MCLLNKISEYFFFSLVNHYMEFEVLTGWVWRKPRIVLSGQFLFWKKNVFETIANFDKKTCRAECLLHPSLILEKDVDHPSLQRFSPDGWIVLKKILLWYDATLILLFVSIQINYTYPMKICKSLHFCVVKVGFSFLLVIFLFKI